MLDPVLPTPPPPPEMEERILRRDSRTGVSSTMSAAKRDSSSHPASSAAERKRGLSRPAAPPSLGAAAATAPERRGADLGLSAASLDAISACLSRGDVVAVGGERQRSGVSKWVGAEGYAAWWYGVIQWLAGRWGREGSRQYE